MSPGDPCTVNGVGDFYMTTEHRPFIGAPCVFVKVTKAGLYQVALAADRRRVLSVPKRNLDAMDPETTR